MDIDTTRVRALLDQRDALDEQIMALVAGNVAKKEITCSKCKQQGHTARTCPQKEYDANKP